MKVLRLVIRNFEEITSGTLLVLMSLSTFSNVICRYCFNFTIQQAEEFSRYAFIWVTFLGAALCTKHGRHIVIDGLVLAVPSRIRAACAGLTDIAVLGLMAILVYYGWNLTVSTTQPTSTLHIPMSWVLCIVPVSGVLIILRSLGGMVKNFRLALKGGKFE
jgi:TRAP-type C4-dicarboxylate transport system permease small subunit